MRLLRAKLTQTSTIQAKLCFGLECLAHTVVTVLRAEDAGTETDAMAKTALVKERRMPPD